MKNFISVFAIIFAFLPGSWQGEAERLLLAKLFSSYEVLERPVEDDNAALEVKFGLTLQQIIDVDEKNQIIESNIWLQMKWIDYRLSWDPKKYANITVINVPVKSVWRPDVLMYNSADEKFDATFPTNAVVESTGQLTWIPPGMFKSTCNINIQWFPFDDQQCELKFGSWTYDGTKLNLTLMSDSGDISAFIKNGEWTLLGVTILLSLTVFLLLVAEAMPPTSDAIPLIGLYFACTMLMCSLSVICTVLVLNFHWRRPDTHEMPQWVHRGICQWLAWLLRMERPGHVLTRKELVAERQLQLQEKTSRSLLANVLDIDDDIRSLVDKMSSPDRGGFDIMGKTGSRTYAFNNGKWRPRGALAAILRELRVITNQLREDQAKDDESSEWKFAAMVIDRLCLYVFLLTTLVSTAAIFFSAPNIFA